MDLPTSPMIIPLNTTKCKQRKVLVALLVGGSCMAITCAWVLTKVAAAVTRFRGRIIPHIITTTLEVRALPIIPNDS